MGEDEQVAARVLQIRDLPPRACLPKACTLTTLSEEPSLREDILIKLSFPLASDQMLLCDSAVLEVTTPRGDRHKVSGIPQPARGTPVYSRGDLVLGLGAILTAESNPVLLPHADNIDILAFRAVRGYESTAEIAVTISLKTVTAMTQPGVYHVMWCSGQLRSNRLAVAVAP